MELIDKDKIVREIEKELNTTKKYSTEYVNGKKYVLKKVLSFLDTLETKEVDLEKEIELVKGDYEQVDVAWNNDFDYIAKHFYELGLNARGE